MKTKTIAIAIVIAAAFSSIAIACGDSTKPPPNTVATTTPADTAAASSGLAPPVSSDTAPASSSSSPPSDPQPPASADAGGGAPPPSKPPVIIGETKDECTPVGVDFEKRARPKMKDCYLEGKKKNPNLEGTVKIKMTVDVKGKIKSVKVIEKTLPDPVAECMLKIVKATPFPEVEKCWDSTLTIPITFPTPK